MNSDKISAEQCRCDKVELVFTIVSRGLGEKVTNINRSKNVSVNMIVPGRGTATTSILEMFGLGVTEKDVVISFVPEERVSAVLECIASEMDFSKPGSGIAFSVPIQSVAGAKVLHYLNTASFEEG